MKKKGDSPTTPDPTGATVRVLKEGATASLSGRSTLTYQLGQSPSGIHLRIKGNSGNGSFSGEWISLKAVLEILEGRKEPFVWDVLCPLFEGRSRNTAGFALGVLNKEGLVRLSEEKPGAYEAADPDGFLGRMKELTEKPKKGGKKARDGDEEERAPGPPATEEA